MTDDLVQQLFAEADNFKVDREVGVRGMLYRAADRIEAQAAEIERLKNKLSVETEPSPYCPICGSCGDEGCCGSKRCMYPDTGIEVLEAEIERLLVEAKAQFDRGYYDGCSNPIVRHDVSFRELAAVLYQKSAEFQVGLTVADSYTLAAEAIAFLQEQSK